MVSAIDAALSGLAREGKTIEASARAIATPPANSSEQRQSDQLSLSEDAKAHAAPRDVSNQLINLKTASYGFKGDLAVIKTQDKMNKSLLDIKS